MRKKISVIVLQQSMQILKYKYPKANERYDHYQRLIDSMEKNDMNEYYLFYEIK